MADDFNIENFPTSETAKRMMTYITGNGFYDKSYVGKWIFQVMGLEWDEAYKFADELQEQFFVETATWGLKYLEMMYSLPVREDIPVEERRRRLLEQRDTKAPMTPYRMEQIILSATGCTVHIGDINDTPNYTEHPNVFWCHVDEDGKAIDVGGIEKTLNKLKQSHTDYKLSHVIRLGLVINVKPREYGVQSALCGTLPKIDLWGDIQTPELDVDISSVEAETMTAKAGMIDTGTAPKESVQASISGAALEARMTENAAEVLAPMSGQSETGTVPKTSVEATIAHSMVEARPTAESNEITSQKTGTQPKTSTAYTDGGSGLSATASAASYSINSRICGSKSSL